VTTADWLTGDLIATGCQLQGGIGTWKPKK